MHIPQEWGSATTYLIGMMYQRLPPICLLQLGIGRLAAHPKDLVIVLCLAPLELHLCLLDLNPQRLHIRSGVIEFGLLERRSEVAECFIVFFLMQVDAGTGAQGFEGGGMEGEGGVNIGEGVVVVLQLVLKCEIYSL
jgi:hypothetical protein